MKTTVRVSSKGQVVLPARLREKASIKKGDVLLVKLVGDKIVMEAVETPKQTEWSDIVRDTQGVWHDVEPRYVEELREAAGERLDTNP